MTKTGVFATKEELEFLMRKAQTAATMPVMALSVADGLAGRDFSSLAHRSALEACHAIALQHGLPEIVGFYGVTQEGEFVRM